MIKAQHGSLQKARRYYHTLRYLKPVQVAGRVYPELKKRAAARGMMLTRLPAPPAGLAGRLVPGVPFCYHEPWNTREALLAGRFCFLNHEAHLGRPVAWEAPGRPILWRYNLHYFHYLPLLLPAEQEALCLDWVGANPVGRTVGWYPYPLSLRIVNWCKAGFSHPVLLRSLYEQAAYLARNMEAYHPGNHWLENAKALVFAACFFGGRGEALRWREQGLRILRQETPRQVLPDGGYFERSPMYHALVLEGYLDLVNVLPATSPDRALLAGAAKRMGGFLEAMTHPDGHIALFNDATQEIAPPTAQLLAYAEALLGRPSWRRTAFPDTGYYVCKAQDLYLVVDAGPVGPDFLPAHAHADLFSFELSLRGLPFVVDSGTYDYEAGPFRTYLRGTRAHNTVCVDGVDQAECWKSFRVARRFAPRDVLVREVPPWQFRGTFDGYSVLIGDDIVHTRRITWDEDRRAIHVQDAVEGRGTHTVESLLHLHPAVSARLEGSEVTLERDGIRCRLAASTHPATLEAGWYCPRFGLRQRNRVLVCGGRQQLPVVLGYTVSY